MKLSEALTLGKTGHWKEAQVRVSPGDANQWFIMLNDATYKSFFLVDEDDKPITSEDITPLAELIRSIGLKEFTVFL